MWLWMDGEIAIAYVTQVSFCYVYVVWKHKCVKHVENYANVYLFLKENGGPIYGLYEGHVTWPVLGWHEMIFSCEKARRVVCSSQSLHSLHILSSIVISIWPRASSLCRFYAIFSPRFAFDNELKLCNADSGKSSWQCKGSRVTNVARIEFTRSSTPARFDPCVCHFYGSTQNAVGIINVNSFRYSITSGNKAMCSYFTSGNV